MIIGWNRCLHDLGQSLLPPASCLYQSITSVDYISRHTHTLPISPVFLDYTVPLAAPIMDTLSQDDPRTRADNTDRSYDDGAFPLVFVPASYSCHG
jgi:hypothetical protein